MYTYIPQNSFAILNCQKPNLTEGSRLNWAVRLPNSDGFINLQEANNSHFMEDPQRNSSGANTPLFVRSPRNGTSVRCRTIQSAISTSVIEITLIVFGKFTSYSMTPFSELLLKSMNIQLEFRSSSSNEFVCK